MLNAHRIECLINFKVNFDYIEERFNNRKINRYGLYVVKKEIWQKFLSKSKKRICNTVISHVNSKE